MAKENNTHVSEAIAQYEYLTGDEERERIEYLKEKYEHDMSNLMWHKYKEGEAKGVAESKREFAIKMLRANIDINQIMEITGYTKEELEELKNTK